MITLAPILSVRASVMWGSEGRALIPGVYLGEVVRAASRMGRLPSVGM